MKIYVLIGKSSTGKDTLYKKLLEDVRVNFKTVVTYTTRPIRDNEKDGVEYFFKTKEEYEKINKNEIIEERCYKTVYGDWYYFMMKDNQIDTTSNDNYLLIGTLPTYLALKKNYEKENVIPLYIEVDDETRLTRAMKREKQQKEPKYEELCRRFLADAKDFSDNKLKRAGIKKRYNNIDSDMCVSDIIDDIEKKNNMMEVVERIMNNIGNSGYYEQSIISFFNKLAINDIISYSSVPCDEKDAYIYISILHRFGFLQACYENDKTGDIINVHTAINEVTKEKIPEDDFGRILSQIVSQKKSHTWNHIWKVIKL